MYKYGFMNYFEAEFDTISCERMEMGPWTNVYLTFTLKNEQNLPEDLQEASGLAVYDPAGDLQDLIVLNEGVDCEYKFTDKEKDFLNRFLEINKG